MKIGGIDPSTLPSEQLLVIPRGEKQIVFRARGLPDFDEFDELCPAPEPPAKLTPKGKEYITDDPNFLAARKEYTKRQLAYMVVKSLIPSEIEWDTVDLTKPASWPNWEADLKKAGITQTECNRVYQLCREANTLDEQKLEEARDFFLRGQAAESAT